MRRPSFLAGLAILAITVSIAQAQGRIWQNDPHGDVVFNGIPASATSITPNNPTPGIPPSATSITPAPPNMGFDFNRPIFRTNGFNRDFNGDFHRHHRVVVVPVAVPVYYPYYYPPSEMTDYSNQEQPQPSEEVAQPEPPAPTIFESRPGYQPPPIKPYQSSMGPTGSNQPNDNTAQPPAAQKTDDTANASASEPEPTTILVFRDGHQLEIGNYAIVGDTLYNLDGNYKAHKILLADLDLDKTVKVNQDRGYDFRLPQQGN